MREGKDNGTRKGVEGLTGRAGSRLTIGRRRKGVIWKVREQVDVLRKFRNDQYCLNYGIILKISYHKYTGKEHSVFWIHL